MTTLFEASFAPLDVRDTRTPAGVAAGATAPPAAHETTTRGADALGRPVSGAHDTLDRGADAAAPDAQEPQDESSPVFDALKSRAGPLRQTRGEWVESLRTPVRANPLAALAAALTLGLLVSRITRH